jgi:phosphoenolpyruvate carboxylase
MKTVADLAARRGALPERSCDAPLFNPVFPLSLDLSRAL